MTDMLDRHFQAQPTMVPTSYIWYVSAGMM